MELKEKMNLSFIFDLSFYAYLFVFKSIKIKKY